MRIFKYALALFICLTTSAYAQKSPRPSPEDLLDIQKVCQEKTNAYAISRIAYMEEILARPAKSTEKDKNTRRVFSEQIIKYKNDPNWNIPLEDWYQMQTLSDLKKRPEAPTNPDEQTVRFFAQYDCFAKHRAVQLETKKGSKNDGVTSKTARYGALSIDRMQGNTYGWSVDEASLAQAREKTLAECNKLSNAPCAVVMEFGNTCASYAVDSARSSSVYGWAYAPTKPEAAAAALLACGERGGGNSQCLVRVWGCTSNAVQAGKR